MLRDDATVNGALDRAAGFSAMQGHDNIIQHGHGANERVASSSDVKRRDKKNHHGLGANRRVAGAAEGQGRDKSHHQFRYSHLDKGKSKQVGGPGQLYPHGPSKTDSLPGKQIPIFGPFEPILTPDEPVFVFVDTPFCNH